MTFHFLLLAPYLALAPAGVNATTFSHQLHIETVGLSCIDCHQALQEGSEPSGTFYPSVEVCLTCHVHEGSDDCTVCRSIDRLKTLGKPIAGLIFRHQDHLTNPRFLEGAHLSAPLDPDDAAGVRTLCLSCHRGMEKVALGGPENFPAMTDCLSCHEFEGDPMRSCQTCHSPEFNLRPHHHQDIAFFDDHSRTESDLDRSRCQACHSPRYNPCTQCH